MAWGFFYTDSFGDRRLFGADERVIVVSTRKTVTVFRDPGPIFKITAPRLTRTRGKGKAR